MQRAKLLDTETYKAEWGDRAGGDEDQVERWRWYRRFRSVDEPPPGGKSMLSGGPPPDSSYRCVALSRRTGLRCRRWALRGYQRCPRHCGASRRVREAGSIANRSFKVKSLPAVYTRYLSQTLLSKMAEMSGVKDQMDLTEELRLMRVAALDTIQTYDAIASLEGTGIAEDKLREAKVMAGLVMKEALEAVISTVDKMASIDAKRRDKVDVGSLHVVVNQIVERAHEAFGDLAPIEVVRKFADACREIRLPTQDVKGTSITPDQDAREMNDTIPR